jgi:hypothetical protein
MGKGHILSTPDVNLLKEDHQRVDNLTAGRMVLPRGRRQARRVFGYSGDFLVENVDATTVKINDGEIMAGTRSIQWDEEAFQILDIDSLQPQYAYVYTWARRLLSLWIVSVAGGMSATKPVVELREIEGLDTWIYPIECAKVYVTNGAITRIRQSQYGSETVAGVIV